MVTFALCFWKHHVNYKFICEDIRGICQYWFIINYSIRTNAWLGFGVKHSTSEIILIFITMLYSRRMQTKAYFTDGFHLSAVYCWASLALFSWCHLSLLVLVQHEVLLCGLNSRAHGWCGSFISHLAMLTSVRWYFTHGEQLTPACVV